MSSPALTTYVSFEITEDYRSGKSIYHSTLSNVEADEKDCETFLYNGEPFYACLVNDKYRVYQFNEGNSYNKSTIKFLKEFPSKEEANNYAKQQYVHYTGYDPFITTGMGSAYKATGDRPEIDLTNSSCDVIKGNLMCDSAIFIVSNGYFCGNVLNPYIEWHFDAY
jgi:hypothetical protein